MEYQCSLLKTRILQPGIDPHPAEIVAQRPNASRSLRCGSLDTDHAPHPLAPTVAISYLRRSAIKRDPAMAKGQKKSNKEIRKPKKEKPKANAAGSSYKTGLGPKQSDF